MILKNWIWEAEISSKISCLFQMSCDQEGYESNLYDSSTYFDKE